MSTLLEPKIKPPRNAPRYAVVVENDDDHTFRFVIEVLQQALNYPKERCEKHAHEMHNDGRSIVWTGMKEYAEIKQERIISLSRKRDPYASKKVHYPLSVVLEEVP